MACCIPQIGAGARVDDGNFEWKCLILESRVVVAFVVMSIRNVCVCVCVYLLNCTYPRNPALSS